MYFFHKLLIYYFIFNRFIKFGKLLSIVDIKLDLSTSLHNPYMILNKYALYMRLIYVLFS